MGPLGLLGPFGLLGPDPFNIDNSITGTPPITLFFGPVEIYRVIGKTVLKEEGFSSKWENLALKNARVR